MTDIKTLEELKEKLAAIEHERWADWQKWCHQVIRENGPNLQTENVLMRWDRQIETPYAELSEKEKQSDREQVDRYLPLINLYIEEKIKEGKLEMLDKMCSRQEDGSFWYIDMAGWEVEEWYEEMKAELEK